MINVGTELEHFLKWFFLNAKPDCKCVPRANLLNLFGPRWTRENIETVIDWLMEEAEDRGIVAAARDQKKQPAGHWWQRMAREGARDTERALAKTIILRCCKRAEAKHRAALRVSR